MFFKLSHLAESQETDPQPYFLAAVLQEVLAQGFALKSLPPMVCAVQLALSQW